MQPLIGIDLGTTNSLIAVFENGVPRLLPNALGEFLTPSAVGLLESGEVLVGRAACELSLTAPERVARNFKRLMGTERKLELGGREFSAPELSSLVLAALKADAQAALGVDVKRAVITVPAYFNQLQRADTKRAGLLAGLEVQRIVNEPTAAALAYGMHERGGDRTLLVFDLGGGTFDVTVMEVFEGALEILSTAGESRLGGEDFTAALVAHALRAVGLNMELAELEVPLLVARLNKEAERAKRELGERASAHMRMPTAQGELSADSQRITLSVAEFEKLCAPFRARLQMPLERALRDARKAWGAIDEVLLVGGATRMPQIRSLVSELSGKEAREALHPDFAVALGAAVQAALIANDKAVDDLVMTDVCPFSLGVEVSKQFGTRSVEGFYVPIIHRNSTVPTSREEFVYTLQDGQACMDIKVYQGEGRKVEQNVFLGSMQVTGIPPGPRGQQVSLRYTYDLNGLLEVEARIEATGKRFELLLRNHAVEMSDRELEQARKRMQDLKFYPRDDLENKHLLLFAEACMKEVTSELREVLDSLIDSFEYALQNPDRATFGDCRNTLLEVLARAGFRYEGSAGDE